MDTALFDAFEATWPAEDYTDVGGFRLGRAPGAGGRVNSARAAGPWSEADIEKAIAKFAEWGQPAVFRVLDDNAELSDALLARGLRRAQPTAIMACPIGRLTDRPVPPMTALTVWPPLAIQRDIWAAGNINAARQQVMSRVPEPHHSILGRIKDRAAGAAFVAVHGNVAMVHAVEVLSQLRRQGLGRWMMRQAAIWAEAQGATRMGLAVSRSNGAAVTMYRDLGLDEVAGYGYFQA